MIFASSSCFIQIDPIKNGFDGSGWVVYGIVSKVLPKMDDLVGIVLLKEYLFVVFLHTSNYTFELKTKKASRFIS